MPTTSPDPHRLTRRLADARAAGRRLLIPYITSGYPRPQDTPEIMRRLEAAGADILELGIPFSDPLADGPTIQRASQRALEQGMGLHDVLVILEEFRTHSDLPVVLFSYLNPILACGTARFIAESVAAGADGVLITDLPVGADPALEMALEESPLALIRLVAPTTSRERAAEIASRAQGFLYYISRRGVTGARAELRAGLADEIAEMRRHGGVPVAVGFGISTPQQAAEVAAAADGVVVGSAIIDALDAGGIDAAQRLVADMREAMDALK